MVAFDIVINRNVVKARTERIYEHVGKKPFLILLGKRANIETFGLNAVLCNYIFGVKFTETAIVIGEGKPVLYTSKRKGQMLSQLAGVVETVFFNKDEGSSLSDLTNSLKDTYQVVGVDVSIGEMCQGILNTLKTVEIDDVIKKMLSVKLPDEIEDIKKAGDALKFSFFKIYELLMDDEYKEESLEKIFHEEMSKYPTLSHIDPMLIETMYYPKFENNLLRIGISYNGFCCEMERKFKSDNTEEYELTAHLLEIIHSNKNSGTIIEELEAYLTGIESDSSVEMYTIGILDREIDFSENFQLTDGMCFVIRVNSCFSNTFILENNKPVYITQKDSKEDFIGNKVASRSKDMVFSSMLALNEHQTTLMNDLTDEMLEYHRNLIDNNVKGSKSRSSLKIYKKDDFIPRTPEFSLDSSKNYLMFPVDSYSIPFHISHVKNVTLLHSPEGPKLRVNIKDSKDVNEVVPRGVWDSLIKSFSIVTPRAEEWVLAINDMKKNYNKVQVETQESTSVDEGLRKGVWHDVLLKVDQKSGYPKKLGDLELYSKGFKYNEIHIPFDQVTKVFYLLSDNNLNIYIQIHLNKHILLNGKPTLNLQFYKKSTQLVYNTSKVESEHMLYMKELEEEEWIVNMNAQLNQFIEKVSSVSNLRPLRIEETFYGVSLKEFGPIYISNDCVVGINDHPFFLIFLDDVEVVVFERVSFSIKTFDLVFVFKDKTRPVKIIGSVNSSDLSKLKTLFDMANKVFFEISVSINWKALLPTISDDPIGFYQSGGWSDMVLNRNGDDISEESDEELSSSSSSENLSSDSSDFTDQDTEELENSSSDGYLNDSEDSEGSDDTSLDESDEDSSSDDSFKPSRNVNKRMKQFN